jgi:hypothetical protein
MAKKAKTTDQPVISQGRDEIAEIYALCCPRTGEVKYIGKARDSHKRLATHMRDAYRRPTPVYQWICELGATGSRPVLRVLCQTRDWQAEERRLIAAYAESGRLLNVAAGGNAPFCSKEVRAANGRAVAAAIHSDPQRKRIWALKRGLAQLIATGHVRDTTKRKIIAASRTKPELFGALASLVSKVEGSGGGYA